MIDYNKRTKDFIVTCDYCDYVLEGEADSFIEIVERLKEFGWMSVKVSDAWLNFDDQDCHDDFMRKYKNV